MAATVRTVRKKYQQLNMHDGAGAAWRWDHEKTIEIIASPDFVDQRYPNGPMRGARP
ncbi:MAG TPA: hypothetical protein PKM65_10145 [Spirochaetota bacterium]|nr:hypothetical protein [Spirochaetota bacterium]HNT12341.1 hypothetical protein [Spirochaetota bacterium]